MSYRSAQSGGRPLIDQLREELVPANWRRIAWSALVGFSALHVRDFARHVGPEASEALGWAFLVLSIPAWVVLVWAPLRRTMKSRPMCEEFVALAAGAFPLLGATLLVKPEWILSLYFRCLQHL